MCGCACLFCGSLELCMLLQKTVKQNSYVCVCVFQYHPINFLSLFSIICCPHYDSCAPLIAVVLFSQEMIAAVA